MDMKCRTLILMMMFFSAVIFGSALASQSLAASIKNPDTFVEATRNSIETLDPHFMLSSATTCIAYNVYDSLLATKSGKGLSPCLAIRIPTIENKLIRIAEDGSTIITFPIRFDVKFHDQSLLTPEDIKYTFTRGIIVGAKSNLCEPLTGEGSF